MMNIGEFEYGNLIGFQKEIHGLESSEPINSIFYTNMKKMAWYSLIPEKLLSSEDEDGVKYEAGKQHFLLYTYMRIRWPAVRLRERYRGEYKICWPPNLGNRPVISAKFSLGDMSFSGFDYHWLNDFHQFWCSPGQEKMIEERMGNVPEMLSWSDKLPEYTTNVQQPFFYSQDASLAFPLFYVPESIRVTHTYKFDRSIKKTIRMCRWDDKEDRWKEMVNPNIKVLVGCKNGQIPVPQLWGQYAQVSAKELEFWKNCIGISREFYFFDVVSCDSDNPCKYGSSVSINLHSNTPCLAMYWKAENIQARKVNNYANYTNNPFDPRRGRTPINTVSLEYCGDKRFSNMAYDHFAYTFPSQHSRSVPRVPGYNMFSYAHKIRPNFACPGPVLAGIKARLLVHLKKQDPYLIEEEDEDSQDEDSQDEEEEDTEEGRTGSRSSDTETFNIIVRLLVLRKCEINISGGVGTFFPWNAAIKPS